MVIILIHPFPIIDYPINVSAYINLNGYRNTYQTFTHSYYLSDYLLAFMFLWMIILLWNAFNYSVYSDVFAKRLCERYGFTAGLWFCFKCYIVKYPISTVMSTLSLSILVLAYLIRIAERPFHWSLNNGIQFPEDGDYSFDPFLNCLYFTVITMTSCGYGDYTPLTNFGKVISIFNAILGGFIMTLTIISLSKILNFSI